MNKVEIIKVSLLSLIVIILFSIGSKVEVMESKVERLWSIEKQAVHYNVDMMKSIASKIIMEVK